MYFPEYDETTYEHNKNHQIIIVPTIHEGVANDHS